MPVLNWRVAQCTRYATGCTNADQLDQDRLRSREGWQVGGRIENRQGKKPPGSATRQCVSNRSVRMQSQFTLHGQGLPHGEATDRGEGAGQTAFNSSAACVLVVKLRSHIEEYSTYLGSCA